MKNSIHTFKVKEVVRVIDGDTVILKLDLGFYIDHTVYVRLLDVHAPEIRGKEKEEGIRIKHVLISFLRDHLEQGYSMTLGTKKTGKFGRWLGEILIDVDGIQVSANEFINYHIDELEEVKED